MTRKHYKQFAEMLRELRRAVGVQDAVLFAVEQRLILICMNDNPRFDTARFHEAAHV